MGLIAQLKKLIESEDFAEARRVALEIEKSNYPGSLKDVARKALLELGREQTKQENTHSTRLYQAIISCNLNQDFSALPWLPWRIIFDNASRLNHTPTSNPTPQAALEFYTQSYHAEGVHALHYFQQLDKEIITTAISDYFDHEYYLECHPDMIHASRSDAVAHYVDCGGAEETRKPNRLFSNEDIFHHYPWIKRLNVNALYAFVRWPEQFPKIVEIVKKRYAFSMDEICLPWHRPAALTVNQSDNTANSDYLRVLAITKESSSKHRLIKPSTQHLKIHIVIPDFTEGGGGHMTIFRMVLHLEKAGHTCTVWIKDYQHSRHLEGPRISATSNYQPIKAQVLPLSSHFAFACGDALIATSWDTVEIVCANKSFHDHFYLVQDYEPYFYPRGSEALEAELTYSADIKTICASSWLDEIMRTKFKRKSTYFNLSYNPSVYRCRQGTRRGPEAQSEKLKKASKSQTEDTLIVRIAFYARSRTDRRAVNLALKGLSKLKQTNYMISVELFGERQGKVRLPNNVTGYDNGILTPPQLADLYHSCDIGITFSATNYALVPQEMMACGLPVIEIDNESTRAIYPEGTLLLAEPSAQGIANAIEELATDIVKRHAIARNGLAWVNQTSWELSFKRVEEFIRNEVKASSDHHKYPASIIERYATQDYKVLHHSTIENCCASVVIPTYQGGALLQEAVARVQSQTTKDPFEIIIIDSESTDGSIEDLPRSSNISIYQIKKQDFQHGKTRNLGVALAKAPFVAFITQDAIPATDDWLSNLIRPLQEDQAVDAVFGSHRAHPSHPKYLDEWMTAHFNGFKGKAIYRKSDSLGDYYLESPRHRQFMHYYSDNNSCLRKESWMQYPYPDVFYGEDQLWADWVIQADGVKAFAEDAIVFHSHDYTEREEYERARTEVFFFHKYFGYKLGQNRLEIEVGIENEAKAILASNNEYLLMHKDHLLKLLRAKREGYRVGCSDFWQWLFAK